MEKECKGLLAFMDDYAKNATVVIPTLGAVTLQDIEDIMDAYAKAIPPKTYTER